MRPQTTWGRLPVSREMPKAVSMVVWRRACLPAVVASGVEAAAAWVDRPG